MDAGPAGTYTKFHLAGGKPLGGMSCASGGAHGVPSHWICYVTVPSVDDAVKTAIELGGMVRYPAHDIPDVGRFAVIADPTGANISPFTARTGSEEPQPAGAVGTFIWYELLTTAPEAAAPFYERILGWTHRSQDMGPFGLYHLFARAGQDVAGMLTMPEGAPGRPQWLPYLHVEDVDASSARASELGGTIYVQPTDVPDVGRFAVIADPTGASLALFKPIMAG